MDGDWKQDEGGDRDQYEGQSEENSLMVSNYFFNRDKH